MRHRAALLAVLITALVLQVLPATAQPTAGSITGRVTDAAGQPLAGVCVEAYGATALQPREARTAADGTYALTGAPEDTYLVGFNTCADPLAGHVSEWWRDAVSFTDATEVTVAAGQTVASIDAVLEQAGTIAGTVTDAASGQPLADICVVALDDATFAFAQDLTGADGRYAVATLRPGSYLLLFQDCGAPHTHVTEFHDEVLLTNTTGAETRVQVVAGRTATIDEDLALGGAITGTVTALHNGQPVPLLSVGAAPVTDVNDFPPYIAVTGLPPGVQTPSSFDGDYVLGGLVPGEHNVVFNPEAFGDDGYVTEWYAGAPSRAGARTVAVASGRTVPDVNAVLRPTPSMSFICPEGFVADDGFPDVPDSNIHESAIDCAFFYGIASGRADGTYGPQRPVRRDQMATFIANTLLSAGIRLPASPPDAFTDDQGNVHELRINQLAAIGVVGGVGGGRYRPGGLVSRAAMATFLVNAYQAATGFDLRAAGDAFADDEADVHEQNINRAATAGIVVGTSPTTYAPGAAVRRDQMATFLARLLDRSVRDLFAAEVSAAAVGASGPPAASGFVGARAFTARHAPAEAAVHRR